MFRRELYGQYRNNKKSRVRAYKLIAGLHNNIYTILFTKGENNLGTIKSKFQQFNKYTLAQQKQREGVWNRDDQSPVKLHTIEPYEVITHLRTARYEGKPITFILPFLYKYRETNQECFTFFPF